MGLNKIISYVLTDISILIIIISVYIILIDRNTIVSYITILVCLFNLHLGLENLYGGSY